MQENYIDTLRWSEDYFSECKFSWISFEEHESGGFGLKDSSMDLCRQNFPRLVRFCIRAMKRHHRWTFFFLIFQAALTSCFAERDCEDRLNNCTSVMLPALNEARYIFPTTHSEIEGMCKMWSHIMDCIRKYMADCSSEEQKLKFNDAVSDSIDSVHAICSSERYRRDYLENASCFKKVSIESCGMQFKRMVDSAYNPLSLESHICCTYAQYEKCASEPIQRLCGPQTLHLMDHSMSSLKTRCDVINKNLHASGNSCPIVEQPLSSNAISSPRRSPVPSPRVAAQTYNPLSTSAYLMSNPNLLTTPGWTPRTVIYPLPETRRSSRIFRSGSNSSVSLRSYAVWTLTLLAIFSYKSCWIP